MRLLGLDYGSKTVGVAVSDPLGITAQPVETIWREKETHLRKTLARLSQLAEEYQAGGFVLGLPRNMNYSIGERGLMAQEFGQKLGERTGLPIFMWDERLTTVEAERALMEADVRREDRKKHLDSMAAVLILQGYLDSRRNIPEA